MATPKRTSVKTEKKNAPAKAHTNSKAKYVKQEKSQPTPRRGTASPYKKPSTRGGSTRSTTNASDLVSLGANGKDVVEGSGSAVRDLTDKVKSAPKFQRLAHKGREKKAITEEQPEAQKARKKMKAKVAVEKRRVETEEDFLEEEMFESQAI